MHICECETTLRCRSCMSGYAIMCGRCVCVGFFIETTDIWIIVGSGTTYTKLAIWHFLLNISQDTKRYWIQNGYMFIAVIIFNIKCYGCFIRCDISIFGYPWYHRWNIVIDFIIYWQIYNFIERRCHLCFDYLFIH